MLCKDNMPTLITNPRYIIQNISLFPLFFLFFFFKLKEKTKTTYHEMHECNAIQILEAKRNKTSKEEWSQGPCQKELIRLSLLHPKLLKCNSDFYYS